MPSVHLANGEVLHVDEITSEEEMRELDPDFDYSESEWRFKLKDGGTLYL